jgi:ADP-ribose pyrophosphatase YjhB (NUDIX family)
LRALILDLPARLWHRLHGRVQWRLLWLLNAKFMVGVVGVITNDAGELLLLRNRYWPEGSWGLPAGYCRSGERLEDGLARELREETGYELADVELLRVISGYKLRLEALFAARLTSGTRRIDPVEVLEARFFPVSALPDGLLKSHREHVALAIQRGRA